MKRHLILIMALLIFAMHGYAQYSRSHSSFTKGAFGAKALHGSNDFFKSSVITNDNSHNIATSYIRVMRSFTFHFEKATNQNWSIHKKNFLAHFTVEGKKTNAVFNRKGRLLYSLSSCCEKDLPAETRAFISTSYNDCKIICVTKVYYSGENRLIVLLENDKNYVYLWWINAEMQEPMECQKVK